MMEHLFDWLTFICAGFCAFCCFLLGRAMTNRHQLDVLVKERIDALERDLTRLRLEALRAENGVAAANTRFLMRVEKVMRDASRSEGP